MARDGETADATVRVGLISDTHGLLRSAVFEHFDGVAHIIHAGDVGKPSILTELEAIAPVTAVHGNTDGFDIRAVAGETAEMVIAGVRIAVAHGHLLPRLTPAALRERFPDARVIVYGHTHKVLVDDGGGVMVVNPGAAGPARFNVKPSIGILTLGGGDPRVTILPL